MSYLRQIWAIVKKDITAELHTRETTSAMFVFAALSMLIFSFALDLQGRAAKAVAPGALWTTIVFAGTLGLNRAMAREQQTGSIEGLLLAPIDRTAIFFGKALGNLILMLAVEVILLPLGSALFNVAFLKPSVTFPIVLGTIGYATIGTLIAAIAINTRAREVMLPLLLIPLAIPLLIAAVQATGNLVQGATLHTVNGWIQLLIIYDLLSIAIALLTFQYVAEE